MFHDVGGFPDWPLFEDTELVRRIKNAGRFTIVRSKVTMSVIEAGTNAIQHGHNRDASKMVDVEFTVHPDRLEIMVHDLGPGFDLSMLNGDVTSPEHLFDLRGRGIYIMRECMDSVDFEFGPHGTICRMVKHRPPVAAEAAGA